MTAASSAVATSAASARPVTGWVQTGLHTFTGAEAVSKSQGITSDGEKLFFSWNAGLHSMDLGMQTTFVANVFDGIPRDLRDKNSSHIGDIDFYDGQIYAPIENGPEYTNPTIVSYDPDTLQARSPWFAADPNLLSDGIPWIAVDEDRQVAYTGKWDNTGLLNVHRLSDFAITSTIQLSRPITRVQGAEMYRGMLYLARDNSYRKSIEAVDLETGQVSTVFDRNFGTEDEVEGITFVTNDGGTTMMTSDIVQNELRRVDVHSYRVGGDLTPPAITGISIAEPELKPGGKLVIDVESSEAATTTATWSRCVGRKRRLCSRLKPSGAPPEMALDAGTNHFILSSRSAGWAPGRRFNAGRFQLSITPTDQADAIGATSSVSFSVLKKQKPKRSRR